VHSFVDPMLKLTVADMLEELQIDHSDLDAKATLVVDNLPVEVVFGTNGDAWIAIGTVEAVGFTVKARGIAPAEIRLARL
jgi:hypothetical protein